MKRLFKARRDRADARRGRNPSSGELLAEAELLAIDDLDDVHGGMGRAWNVGSAR